MSRDGVLQTCTGMPTTPNMNSMPWFWHAWAMTSSPVMGAMVKLVFLCVYCLRSGVWEEHAMPVRSGRQIELVAATNTPVLHRCVTGEA